MISKIASNFVKGSCFKAQPLYNFSKLVNHRPTDSNSESRPFDFTPDNYKEIEKVLKKYPENYKKSGIMPLLTIAQSQDNNFLSLSAMKKVPEMDVYEVASFYTMYNREPVGKFHLQICGTTPCLLCGAGDIIKTIEEYTGTTLGHSSEDGLWTLDEVECLGACSNAPMIQVNNEWVYEDLTPENTIKLLEDLQNGTEKKGPQNGRKNCAGPLGKTCLNDDTFLNSEVRHQRDFSLAKKEWEDAAKKAKEDAAKKAAASQK